MTNERVKGKELLQDYLRQFLQEEAAKWIKTFPDQFFEDLYKMRHWNWERTTKRPGVVGKWINDIVYSRLAPALPQALDKTQPKKRKWESWAQTSSKSYTGNRSATFKTTLGGRSCHCGRVKL